LRRLAAQVYVSTLVQIFLVEFFMFRRMLLLGTVASAAALSFSAQAEMVAYTVEPTHTAATWAIPHLGISIIRGRFDKTSGKVNLDQTGRAGTVEITIEAASVNAGNKKFEDHLRSKDFFDAEQFPKVTYRGRLGKFEGDTPTEVEGELTLLGQTRPVNLKILSFKCRTHPLLRREVCGADAATTIDRSQFGMTSSVAFSSARVDLMLQIEALRD
jgi:polyisoprenoid-binding protein YceI